MSDKIDENEEQLLQAMSVEDGSLKAEEYIVYAGTKNEKDEVLVNKDDVIAALKKVSDPEIMINIYDLGLVYKVDIAKSGDVNIEMTLTAPTCPVAGVLPQQAADAVAMVENVGLVEVKVVWEPAWSIDKLSPEAKDMLEML